MRDTVFGTPGYLPPEALRNNRFEAPGDLFALGAVAYRCLTGRPAFGGRTSLEILSNTLRTSVPPLREACSDAPAELEAIVAGLLDPDPERRIVDAALLTRELARMSALRGWRWTPPDLSATPEGAPASGAASDVPHAQVLRPMQGNAPPKD